MAPPRISIATLLVIVGVLAVDCVLWRRSVTPCSLPWIPRSRSSGWLPQSSAPWSLAASRLRDKSSEGPRTIPSSWDSRSRAAVVLALVALHWARGRQVDAPLRATKDAIDYLLRSAGLIKHIGDYYTPFWHDFATPIIVCGLITRPRYYCRSSGLGFSRDTRLSS